MNRTNNIKSNSAITLFLLIFILMSTTQLQATIRTVCTSGGCDFTVIQDAVDGAIAADIIEIGSEIFSENIIVNKNLTLKGEGEEILV